MGWLEEFNEVHFIKLSAPSSVYAGFIIIFYYFPSSASDCFSFTKGRAETPGSRRESGGWEQNPVAFSFQLPLPTHTQALAPAPAPPSPKQTGAPHRPST